MIEQKDNEMEMLNQPGREGRLATLRKLVQEKELQGIPFTEEVNNHVHTRYSFSPYSPAAVAYYARLAGLQVVGSVDHESVGAAREMKEAAAAVGMGATVGCEVRVHFGDTPFETTRLNNPDTIGNAYMVIHAIPEGSIDTLAKRLRPLNEAREERNRRQVDNLNSIIGDELGTLNYDHQVRPLSWADDGGSVTERHILYALALRVIEAVPRAQKLGLFLRERLEMTLGDQIQQRIEDEENPHRVYDLLGAFKASFVPQFFIQPDERECPPVREINALAQELGAIPAYAYLGDVGDSPTGDKKAQRFEDAFIDELFSTLPGLGYQAVTYMPPRNTKAQLKRVQELAAGQGLMEISGVDINSSRQSFHCPEVLQPEFRHLIESTWALVGHEKATEEDVTAGIFGRNAGGSGSAKEAGTPSGLSERIARFAELGRSAVSGSSAGGS
jgi:hypothetical protein